MGQANFSDEFKRDAVAQITERGYRVAEVSERLGVSQHSLYAWKRQLAKVVSGDADKDAAGSNARRAPGSADLRAPNGPEAEVPAVTLPAAPTLP